uniref:Innexin n=1 Tax=Meloidogyne incognita TaxID=6306 RepID=A0A914MVJ6_MELIC
MNTIVETAVKIVGPVKVQLDDFVDRLCYKATSTLLFVFALLTTIDTFGKPINCMVPAEFTEIWSNFVHQYCFVTGTYVKNYDADGVMEKVFVGYYQWVPFVLVLQAVTMYLPYLFWDFCQSWSTDVDFSHINSLCAKARTDEAANRTVHLDKAAKQIYQVAKHRGFHGIGFGAVYFYLVFKFCNSVVIVSQIIFLAVFCGKNDLLWGIKFAGEMVAGNSLYWDKFGYFPRVAYCSFGRDFLGSSSGNLVQEARCTLGFNVINEKIFLILFFWFFFLYVLTLVNFCVFFYGIVCCNRIQTVRNYLSLVDRCDDLFGVIAVPTTSTAVSNAKNKSLNTDRKTVADFVNRVLGYDGVLLLHFIKLNNGELVAVEVCSRLFQIDARNKK